MNLLFAIDRNYIPLFSSCIRSIVQNGGEVSYHAYILHSDLEPANLSRIQKAAGDKVTCHFLGIDPALFDGFPVSKRYPQQIYYRLAAPLVLPKELDRILYLDVDTVVINPLHTLYDTDFQGNWFAACTHIKKTLSKLNEVRLGALKDSVYVNTGVLLMNLPALRANFRLEDIRDYTADRKRAFILPDQDILTALYGTKVLLVDTMRYNLSDRILALYNLDPKREKRDVEWVRNNTAIIHYCGKNKPWKEGYRGVLGEFYPSE